MEQTVKPVKFAYKNYHVIFQLLSSSLMIEISGPSEDVCYHIFMNNDSLPEDIKPFFNTYGEIYYYVADQAIPQRFQIEEPGVLSLLVKIGNNLKRKQIHLVGKQMTKEMILEKKIQRLEQQNDELRSLLQKSKKRELQLQLQVAASKQKAINQLIWSKIGAISPEDDKLNLIAKVMRVKQYKKDNKQKLMLGDETGIVTAKTVSCQSIEQGDIVVICNAIAELVAQHIQLHLMEKGTIKLAIDQSKGINKEFDVSKKIWVPIQ